MSQAKHGEPSSGRRKRKRTFVCPLCGESIIGVHSITVIQEECMCMIYLGRMHVCLFVVAAPR